MTKHLLLGTLAAVAVAGALTPAAAAQDKAEANQAPQGPVFNIPRIDGLAIDGNAVQWADRGFGVDVLFDPSPNRKSPSDFDASVRLAWDDRGLWVLLTVSDDVNVEADKEDELWRNDSVELYLCAGLGQKDIYQVALAPGLNAKHDQLRYHVYDLRQDKELKKTPLAIQAARTPVSGGYVMKVLLPWAGLGIEPAEGREVAFQVQINDSDFSKGRLEDRRQMLWFPVTGCQWDTKKMHRLRLSKQASDPLVATATGSYELFRRAKVALTATAPFAGKTAIVRQGDKTLGQQKLTATGRLATAAILLPLPARGETYGQLNVLIDDKEVARADMPNFEQQRTDALDKAVMLLSPFVFGGRQFPSPQFEQPSLVEDLIGPYELKTTYYDANYNPVTEAANPGRYGAIVEIIPHDGNVTRRFVTLFRTEDDIAWRGVDLGVKLNLPKELGLDANVVQLHAKTVSDLVRQELVAGFHRDDSAAVTLAGIYDTKPGTLLVDRLDPSALNDRWWVGLKRKTGTLTPLRYMVHVPAAASTDANAKFPMILFLHGSGGTYEGIPQGDIMKRAAADANFPFIVVAPACPPQTWWQAPLLEALLDEVQAKYPVDPDRIYLTGLSMGGYGSWTLATACPERFAAVAPVCGGGDPEDVERLKDLPIWDFHGAKDQAVPIEQSYKMVVALRRIHGRIRFTLYPEGTHFIWGDVYAKDELYSWFLRQTRGKPQQPPADTTSTVPNDQIIVPAQ